MNQERFALHASVLIIFKQDDKILLLLRKNITSDGLYGLVAGHLDDGETITQAFIREAKEEVGVNIDPKNLKISGVSHSYSRHNNRQFIQFYAICDQWDGELKNMEPEKCGDIEFFKLDNLPKNIVPYIKNAIEKILQDGEFYFEYGWEE